MVLFYCALIMVSIYTTSNHICLYLVKLRIVVGWSYGSGIRATYVIGAYNQLNHEFESHLWRGVLGTKLWDKVCQRLPAGPWFFLVAPMLSTNETERHDITGILLTIVLSTITLTLSKCVVGEKIIKTNNVKNVFLNTKNLEINQSDRYSNCHFCRH